VALSQTSEGAESNRIQWDVPDLPTFGPVKGDCFALERYLIHLRPNCSLALIPVWIDTRNADR